MLPAHSRTFAADVSENRPLAVQGNAEAQAAFGQQQRARSPERLRTATKGPERPEVALASWAGRRTSGLAQTVSYIEFKRSNDNTKTFQNGYGCIIQGVWGGLESLETS